MITLKKAYEDQTIQVDTILESKIAIDPAIINQVAALRGAAIQNGILMFGSFPVGPVLQALANPPLAPAPAVVAAPVVAPAPVAPR